MHILLLLTDNNPSWINQRKEENDRRNYFMINLHQSMDRAGIELAIPGSAVRHASVARHVTDCDTRPAIVALFICGLMVLTHVALEWLWHCLSVFSWFFLMLPWIDCDIVFLCSYGSTSCCIELIVGLFICVLMVLPHIALDWLWHC